MSTLAVIINTGWQGEVANMGSHNMDVLGGLSERDLSTGNEETMDKCIVFFKIYGKRRVLTWHVYFILLYFTY